MGNKHIRISDTEHNKALNEIKTDYETVIREQKNRIMKLREDNAELAQKVSDYEKYGDEMARALLDARQKAGEIISDAKKQADSILRQAEEQAARSEKNIEYYRSSLKELEKRSERIFNFIRSELLKEKKPSLSIVNQ